MSINLKENQFDSFGDFLTDKTMIQFGATLIIALQVKQISNNISDSILTPIVDKLLESDINKFKVNIFGIDFILGKIFTSIITFFLTMAIIYTFIKLTRVYKKFDEDPTQEQQQPQPEQEKTQPKK
jgi:large-conductance mechanosensitive channel